MEGRARPRVPYVPALDGLRAVAVLAVVAYHLDAPWARGGYLGVDVFFVLSGYLITSLLLAEHAGTGRIDLAGFWGRRARRLLPALLVVLAAVAAWAAWWADPVARARFRGDGLGGLFYVANWRFVQSEASYFERFASPNPLTHLWSLAIEEQFYLLWPLVCVGVLALTRGRARALGLVCVGGAVASAVWMAVAYRAGDPSRAYYGTDTHAFGLLLGAAAATVPATWRDARRWRIPGTVGAVGVLLAVVALEDTGWFAYRGGIALAAALTLPVVLAADDDRGLGRLLAWSPLVAVGRVSYGLYLWHWPVIVVFDADRTGLHGVALLALRAALTVSLTLVSYRFVEGPVRSGRRLARARVAAPAALAAVAVVAGVVVGATAGTQPVFARPVALTDLATVARPSVEVAGVAVEADDAGAPAGSVEDPAAAPTPTTAPAPPPPPRLLVVGDSIGASLTLGLEPVAADLGIDVVPGAVVAGAARTFCPLDLSTTLIGDETQPPALDPACDWTTYWPALLEAFRPEVVLVAFGFWDTLPRTVDGVRLEPGSEAWHAHMVERIDCAIDVLGAGAGQVAILAAARSPLLDDGHVDALNRAYYEAALASDGNVRFVDIRDDVAANAGWRWDGTHFTADGARRAAAPILAQLGPIEPDRRPQPAPITVPPCAAQR